MPGQLLSAGALMRCPHAASVSITANQTKVLVGGQPVATTASKITVSACQFKIPVPPPPATKPQPCVRVEWQLRASKVLVDGKPALLAPAPGTGAATCLTVERIPQGPPTISQLQRLVSGS
jgi:hypothetical protein